MCGNFVITISVADKQQAATPLSVITPHLMYNFTRMLSYTIIGVAAGFLGSAVSLGAYKGTVNIVAGLLMILMGLNMLNLHPWLRVFSFRLPRRVSDKIFRTTEQADSFAPLVFGLFAGILPCGPLQAMVLYAAGSGSPLRGGLTMLVFGLATIPLMLAYGSVASTLAKRFSKHLNIIGAIIIIILGLAIIDRGLALTGFPYNSSSLKQQVINRLAPPKKPASVKKTEKWQEVEIKAENGYTPDTLTVECDVPVRLIVVNPGYDDCAAGIVFPSEGIERSLKQNGKTVITFTPKKVGTFTFTSACGMWHGTLIVE
jgi:sulfite exporter TauE/SafE